MSFIVNVPVLSEQITVAAPNVSTAGSLRIIALRLLIFWTPRAKTIVTIAGRPSGIAATAKLTAVINISSGGKPRKTPTTNIKATITRIARPSFFPKTSNFRWSGVP